MLACTFYAIKTRHLPENFKETKSIGFAMYSTCILWLLSIPLYLGVQYEHYLTKSHLYAITVSVSGIIILACIFLPKAYIILCKPEKNKEEPVIRNENLGTQNTFRRNRQSVFDSPLPTEQFLCSKCKNEIEPHSNEPGVIQNLNSLPSKT